MPLIVYGFNHRTTPLHVREKLACPQGQEIPLLQAFLETFPQVDEAMLLSTCQRTEWYFYTSTLFDIEQLTHWLAHQHKIEKDFLKSTAYTYENESVIYHIMRVANGLDSSLLGETEILGQLKTAYTHAKKAKTLGKILEPLIQSTFAAAKKVRTHTGISEGSVSLSYTAVSLGRCIFANMPAPSVLVLGTGKVIQATLQHLARQKPAKLMIANRSLDKAQKLAQIYGAQALAIADISQYFAHVDIIISATSSSEPIVTYASVKNTLASRSKPLSIVDMGMPRDCAPEISTLPQVSLYNLEDLHKIINMNLSARKDAAKQAESIIREYTEQLLKKMQIRQAAPTIAAFRQTVSTFLSDIVADINVRLKQERSFSQVLTEAIEALELEYPKQTLYTKALSQLNCGYDAKDVVTNNLHRLTNKLLHVPTMQLREDILSEELVFE